MEILKQHVVAMAVMAAGTGGVLGLLYGMNELTDKSQEQAETVTKDFVVEKQRKKPPKRQLQKKPKAVKQTQTARRAPMPNITTALSGMSFDLPEFENADLMGAAELTAGAGDDDKLVMTEDAVDSLPRPRSQPPPDYPRDAQQRGITGYVLLEIKVSESGDVERVRVVEANPRGVFEDVAISAVERWTFEPARYKGDPVAIAVSQKIPFQLTRRN